MESVISLRNKAFSKKTFWDRRRGRRNSANNRNFKKIHFSSAFDDRNVRSREIFPRLLVPQEKKDNESSKFEKSGSRGLGTMNYFSRVLKSINN